VRLLDTDILIDIQRGHAPALAWFAGVDELPLVSGFTKHYAAVPGLATEKPYSR
jgi:hypothetical protein